MPKYFAKITFNYRLHESKFYKDLATFIDSKDCTLISDYEAKRNFIEDFIKGIDHVKANNKMLNDCMLHTLENDFITNIYIPGIFSMAINIVLHEFPEKTPLDIHNKETISEYKDQISSS